MRLPVCRADNADVLSAAPSAKHKHKCDVSTSGYGGYTHWTRVLRPGCMADHRENGQTVW